MVNKRRIRIVDVLDLESVLRCIVMFMDIPPNTYMGLIQYPRSKIRYYHVQTLGAGVAKDPCPNDYISDSYVHPRKYPLFI